MKHEPILNVFLLFWETLISKKKNTKKEARNMEKTSRRFKEKCEMTIF